MKLFWIVDLDVCSGTFNEDEDGFLHEVDGDGYFHPPMLQPKHKSQIGAASGLFASVEDAIQSEVAEAKSALQYFELQADEMRQYLADLQKITPSE